MSNNPKLVIFGSFTEEETQFFQKEPIEHGKPSLKKTCMQFGTLKLDSMISPDNLKPKPEDPDVTQSSKSACAPSLIANVNGNTTKTVEAKKLAVVHLNGSTKACYINSDKSSANGDVPGFQSSVSTPTGLSPGAEVVDRESLKDVLSTTTESSLENEIYPNSFDTLNSKEDFPKRDTEKILNEGCMAVKPLLPRGLINSGNLCFLNATLQALLSCSSFIRLLQNLRTHKIPKTGYPTLQAFVQFISEFDMPEQHSLSKSDASAIKMGNSFSPIMFEVVLKIFTPDLPASISGRPRQEDAQEFLSFILDQMHDELLKLDGHLSISNGAASYLVSSAEDDGWETVGPKNKSAVTRTQSFVPSELSAIFGGQLRSVVKARGNKASATVQPFLLLHLDIFPDAVHTIEDAFHLFSVPETLEGYKASDGKSMAVCASKSVKIQTVPKILILHLMRFSYGQKGSSKLHKPLRFGLELVLGRELLVSPSVEGRRYELVATISHHGRDPSKGHYTADARCSNGRWLRYDDSSVTSVSTSKVLHDRAYVLFYKQV